MSQGAGDGLQLERTAPLAAAKPLRGEAVAAVLTDDGRVAVTVRVQEGDGAEMEYTASLPLDLLGRLSPEEQRRAMAEACRLERDRVRRRQTVDLDGLLGSVDLE